MCYVLDEDGKVRRAYPPKVRELPNADKKAGKKLLDVYEDFLKNGVNLASLSELLKKAGSLDNLVYTK